MELRKHYEQYKVSVTQDALDGFPDYAKTCVTADPELWPTVYDFLSHAVRMVKHAAEADDVNTYSTWLRSHQGAMIQLFERMAWLEMDKYPTVTEGTLALVSKGWNWFKFGPAVVPFTTHVWFPRHAPQFHEAIHGSLPSFSANEMRVILAAKPPKHTLDAIAERRKKETFVVTGFRHDLWEAFPVERANEKQVNDWTLELFK